ncbi:MAG: rRNA maturation RNase YbeY [Clostridiales bacterium]|jgi:probable rRNA maturation factor|nr:rRNA maturation RNase YbeY [Clostridiales bacterium]
MAAVILNEDENTSVSPRVTAAMEQIVQKALLEHNLPVSAEVSVMLCDNETIKKLNREWRSLDNATDVLSFPLHESLKEGKSIVDEEFLLGDIIISLERAGEQALEFAHSLEREILYLFVHGLLHLLGYDHCEDEERLEMRRREEGLLAMVGAERNE